jgi:hypothetical protein
LGYELFNDKGKLKATFLPADIFDPESALKQIDGQISIIYTGSFFHLFDWDEQFRIAKRIVPLLKPETNSLIVGRQVGNVDAGVHSRVGFGDKKERFRHNPASWAELWQKVGEETGTKWKVECTLDENLGQWLTQAEYQFIEQRREFGARRLKFVVRRL